MEIAQLIDDEPTPQILSKDIFDPDANISEISAIEEKNNILNTPHVIIINPIKTISPINEIPEDEETINNIGDETVNNTYTNTNILNMNNQSNTNINQITHITTSLEDLFKATIQQMRQQNTKSQLNIDQCCYDFSKEISRLKIGTDQNFQIRMIFDIFKRQLKEKELEKVSERCKIKIAEEIRAKGFNRLIEDANRRMEAYEQLENMKGKLDEELIVLPSKKYRDNQWKEIYNERFLKYKNEKEKKIQKKVEEKKKLEKKKEEEIIELCKVKKAPMNVVEEYGKRLYEEPNKKGKDGNNAKGSNRKKDKDKEKGGLRDKKQISHDYGVINSKKATGQSQQLQNKLQFPLQLQENVMIKSNELSLKNKPKDDQGNSNDNHHDYKYNNYRYNNEYECNYDHHDNDRVYHPEYDQDEPMLENLKENLRKTSRPIAKITSKSQEKYKEKKTNHLFGSYSSIPHNSNANNNNLNPPLLNNNPSSSSIQNKRDSIPKLKKLKYTDFMPVNTNQKKLFDQNTTNKIFNNFFSNQLHPSANKS